MRSSINSVVDVIVLPLPLTASAERSPPGKRRRLARDRRGVSAVEFAIVGPLFMLFIGMIFENGILLFQQSILDNATARASRLIRTGQIQLAGTGATSFTTELCTQVGVIIPCASLQYKVSAAAAFSSLSTTVATNGAGVLTGNGTFSPGTSGQDVVVQVAWNRPYIIPWVGNLVNPGGGSFMTSTYAFRNELFN